MISLNQCKCCLSCIISYTTVYHSVVSKKISRNIRWIFIIFWYTTCNDTSSIIPHPMGTFYTRFLSFFNQIIILNNTHQWRIQDFPCGGDVDLVGGSVDPRGGYLSKILHVKTKESGAVGGGARPPRSANAHDSNKTL